MITVLMGLNFAQRKFCFKIIGQYMKQTPKELYAEIFVFECGILAWVKETDRSP